MSFTHAFEKTAAEVCMPKSDFIKEHRHLVKILRHPKKKELEAEAKDQAKELEENRGN